jgi:hypothetical protein
MKKYEYKVVHINSLCTDDTVESNITRHGKLGYELVCIDGERYFFKRSESSDAPILRAIFRIYFVVGIIVAWIVISSSIQAFKCPEMTQTEQFLSIPKSFVMQWDECE